MKPQRLGVHNQHDQSPGELKKKNSIVNICNVHTFYCSKQYINQQHYKPLAHYFPPFLEVMKLGKETLPKLELVGLPLSVQRH
jgi:hypothetical protein